MELADEPTDDRTVSFLGQGPVFDGGQWDMAVNVLGTQVPDGVASSTNRRVQRNTDASPRSCTRNLSHPWHHPRSTISSHPKSENLPLFFEPNPDSSLFRPCERSNPT